MKIHPTDKPPKKDSGKKRPTGFYIAAVIAVVLIVALFLFWNNSGFFTPNTNQQEILAEQTDVSDTLSSQNDLVKSNELKEFDPKKPVYAEPPIAPAPLAQSDVRSDSTSPPLTSQENSNLDNASKTVTNTDPDNEKAAAIFSSQDSNQNPSADTCSVVSKSIQQFYTNLDNDPYVKSFNLPTSTDLYFSRLIGSLLENPPVVSGETNDLFTILQNTAHFFRIIGKDNIIMLKGILDKEKDTFEYVLSDYYTLIHIPGCLEKSFSFTAPFDSLYDYAGFFLNTMGGRLYLFRRDSMSRMVVSYYAILLIDHANKNGNNSHGIDIRPSLDLLINEIESTSNTLQLKEEYLDTLYSLKEEYQ